MLSTLQGQAIHPLCLGLCLKLCAAFSLLSTPVLADTIGLRFTPRNELTVSGAREPASLRFSLSRYDGSFLDINETPAPPLLLNLSPNLKTTGSSSLSADWFPFKTGLRTSVGLVWQDSRGHGDALDRQANNGVQSRAFLGLGWTASASSSSTGSGWRIDADVGASLSATRNCVASDAYCFGVSGAGLKPNSGGDGIRWNPFIRIGASFQY